MFPIRSVYMAQPSPKAFLARSNLDPTLTGDVTEKEIPSQTSRETMGQEGTPRD